MIMQALAPTMPEGDEPLPEVFLQLYETTFPKRYLPKGENGETLSLPASARLLIGNEGIKIDVIVEFDLGYDDYESRDFDDNPPLISMGFRRDKILRLEVGGRIHSHPTAILVIADPTGVDEGFTLTFASTDSNNRAWHIKKLSKDLRERLGVETAQVEPPKPRLF
jgi:hypothetical protein